MDLTVEGIQEALKNLLRTQVVAHLTIGRMGERTGGMGGLGVSVAKAACAAAGVPEDEVRAVVDGTLAAFGEPR